MNSAGRHESKSLLYRSQLIVIGFFKPSSKTCCNCGALKEVLLLGERIYRCDCSKQLDRDLNAAINIQKYTGEVLSCLLVDAVAPSPPVEAIIFWHAKKERTQHCHVPLIWGFTVNGNQPLTALNQRSISY
jgi:hypothetical protein